MAERLSLQMECHDGGVVLRLAGRLEASTVPLVAGTLSALEGGARGAVRVDLEGIRTIDGAGIALLLSAQAAARDEGHEFEVSGLQASLRRRDPGPMQPRECAPSGNGPN